MVIDADGLNAVTGKTDLLSRLTAPAIITPASRRNGAAARNRLSRGAV